MKFNHSENQIDPRDKNLISYNRDSKSFIVDASDLKANGITPMHHVSAINNCWIIWMWSERLNKSLAYKRKQNIMDPSGEELVATEFIPFEYNEFTVVTTLHILND